MTVRVVVADDQELVRAGFVGILAAADGIAVVGEAATGLQAVQACREQHPDVVLMDIRMPDMDGLEATRLITGSLPDTRVLILTTFDLDEYVFGALRSGASGFLLKDTPARDLVHAIGIVASGEALLAPKVTRTLIEHFTAASTPAVDLDTTDTLDAITPREREVLSLIADGLTNAEIAQRLFISQGTVKTHVKHLLTKLQARDRVHLVIIAYSTLKQDSGR